MIRRQLLYLLGCLVLVFIPTVGYAEQNVRTCTQITIENANALDLFFEAEGFSDTSLADVFSDMTIFIDILAWSPDSTRLSALGTDFSIDEVTVVYSPQEYPIVSAYQPDGTPLAFRGNKDMLEIWHGETGELIHRLEVGSDYIADPTLSSDGKLLAFGDGNYQVQLWEMTTGERLHMLDWPSIPVGTLAFDPTGTLLASGAYGASPLLWDISTGILFYDLSNIGVDNHVWDVEFSPDGSLLAITNYGSVALVDMGNLPDKPPVYINEYTAASDAFNVAFSPDGTLLTVVGVQAKATPYEAYYIEVWNVSTRTKLNEWRFDKGLYEVAFSPDGCFLAVTGHLYENTGGGIIKLWRVAA